MPIISVKCADLACLLEDEILISFQEAESGRIESVCSSCGGSLKRDWTNNSISATVEGGTGGGAGMGLVSKMPPAKEG